jgi:hypothetical protein
LSPASRLAVSRNKRLPSDIRLSIVGLFNVRAVFMI